MQAALLDPAQASDVIKELSAELPAALFERLGLLPGGTRHLLKPADFLEGGKVDRQLGLGQGTPSSGVWLGPQLEAVQRPIASKPHSRVPAEAEELKAEMSRLKATMYSLSACCGLEPVFKTEEKACTRTPYTRSAHNPVPLPFAGNGSPLTL